MRIFVVGDTHGGARDGFSKLNSDNFPAGKNLTKDDFVIICGDFGLAHANSDKQQEYWIKWLQSKPWTTLFVEGNHDDHDNLLRLPTENMFCGEVGKLTDSIYHLRRGQIFIINDIRLFCMGGALTTDMIGRIEGVHWWRNEIASYKEMSDALDELERRGNKVDYVIAHTLPKGMVKRYFAHVDISTEGMDSPETFDSKQDEVLRQMCLRYNDPMSSFFQEVCERVEFKHWYCGHFHDDITMGNFTILFDKVVELF
jgi:predicted phosphodiesterase